MPFNLRERKMHKAKSLALTIYLLWTTDAFAYVSIVPIQNRRELLYTTHCVTCHTSLIHWRNKALATDWHSLKFQVRRWQNNLELGWSKDEIIGVTRYLNGIYYHFSY